MVKPELHRMLKVPRPVGAAVQPCVGSTAVSELVGGIIVCCNDTVTKLLPKMYGDNIKRAATVDML